MGWSDRGTRSPFQHREWEQEHQRRERQQAQVRLVVDSHFERYGWEPADREEILGALGVLIGQYDPPALGHDDKRRSRRGGSSHSVGNEGR